ncbi:MAG: hypothetical protein ACRDZX_04930 [Acidimicrobiales bacterium]
MLRFEVADFNRVITGSVANADLYRPLRDDRAHPADWQVLTLPCFAVTPEWTPRRLAVYTGFRSYRLGRAATLASAGRDLWPTEIFVDDVPPPPRRGPLRPNRRFRPRPNTGRASLRHRGGTAGGA